MTAKTNANADAKKKIVSYHDCKHCGLRAVAIVFEDGKNLLGPCLHCLGKGNVRKIPYKPGNGRALVVSTSLRVDDVRRNITVLARALAMSRTGAAAGSTEANPTPSDTLAAATLYAANVLDSNDFHAAPPENTIEEAEKAVNELNREIKSGKR